MTSREFAELVQMGHYNVLKDIRDEVSKLQGGHVEKYVSFEDLGYGSKV